MAVTALPDLLTYERWRELPESNLPQEVIDGVLHMSPAPKLGHQRVVKNFVRELSPVVDDRGLGMIAVSPIDIIIRKLPLRTRQPDVLFISLARAGVASVDELDELGHLESAPELVIEVLSGSDAGELESKLRDYARIGVLECWLVNRAARTIEVLALHEGAYRQVAVLQELDRIDCRFIPGWSSLVRRFFE
jgi:Uma2 family endonuclease